MKRNILTAGLVALVASDALTNTDVDYITLAFRLVLLQRGTLSQGDVIVFEYGTAGKEIHTIGEEVAVVNTDYPFPLPLDLQTTLREN